MISPLGKAFLLVAANWAVATLFFIFLVGSFFASAAMAPEIDDRLLYLFWFLGIGVTISTLVAARLIERGRRSATYLAMAPPAVLYLSFILWIGQEEFASVRQVYLIPNSFHGNVYVLHGVSGAQSAVIGWHKRTYKIGVDGIAIVSDAIPPISNSTYYDQMPDGSLRKISHEWLTTIPDTPENRANDIERGMYFPRTGSGGSAMCQSSFEEFYIGTKAEILSNSEHEDLEKRLGHHPGVCMD